MTAFWNQTNQAFSCFPWFNDYEVRLSGPKEIVSHYGSDFRSHPIGTGPFN
jgi:peptide/nickel transport system substrate-binding protein